MDSRFVFFNVFVLGIVQCNLVNLSCKDIAKFVDGHNSRRLQVAKGSIPGQPAASNMNSMIWDEELARKAAGWAKTQKYGHNPLRTVETKRFDAGENIYMYSTTANNYKFDVDIALDAWFKEYKNYKFAPLTHDDFLREGDQQIGHYTQMMWSDTVYVGCAISKFQQGKFTKYFVVCNYGPGGNYIGGLPYKTGGPSGQLYCGAKDCTRPYGLSC